VVAKGKRLQTVSITGPAANGPSHVRVGQHQTSLQNAKQITDGTNYQSGVLQRKHLVGKQTLQLLTSLGLGPKWLRLESSSLTAKQRMIRNRLLFLPSNSDQLWWQKAQTLLQTVSIRVRQANAQFLQVGHISITAKRKAITGRKTIYQSWSSSTENTLWETGTLPKLLTANCLEQTLPLGKVLSETFFWGPPPPPPPPSKRMIKETALLFLSNSKCPIVFATTKRGKLVKAHLDQCRTTRSGHVSI